MRRQLVGPVGDARPLRRVEELLRRDVQRVGVDVRSAADARAGEDEHVVEVLDPLDPVQLRRGEPQEVRQIPLGLRDVLVLPAPAGLHDTDPVALLRGPQRGDASAEPRADDHHVVVEARHEVSPSGFTLLRRQGSPPAGRRQRLRARSAAFALAFELPRGRQDEERHDHGRPGEEPEHVGADSRPAEVEEAALGVDRGRSDPEVAEEAPERGEHRSRVRGAQARDVEEDEDGERREDRGQAEEHLEQAGADADDEPVEGADADEGEDRADRPGVRAEGQAADQVGDRRHQNRGRGEDEVAAAGQQRGAPRSRGWSAAM